MRLFRLGILLQAICGNSDSNNVVSRQEYLQFIRRDTALENHRKKTSRPSNSLSIFHSPRNEICNIDAAPEISDFGFNRFKAPQD
jgi:hypothetical protein